MDSLENLKNKIEIPKEIDSAVKMGIEKGKKEKKLKKHKKLYKRVAAAAVILVIAIPIGILKPGIVMAIPGAESIFKLIGHGMVGESFGKFEQFSSSVNKSVEKNGIKITINEIAIDDNTIAITSTEQGKNLKKHAYLNWDITLNGKRLQSISPKQKRIDDNTITTVTYSNISDLGLGDLVNVDLNSMWFGDIMGPWNFKFQVSKSKKPTNSRVIKLNKTIKMPNSTLKIENIVIGPLGNTINYSSYYDKVNKTMRDDISDFVVMDDKGRILQTMRGNGVMSNKYYKGQMEILNDLSGVKDLTVVPIFKQCGIKFMNIDKFNYPVLQTTINSANFNVPQETITKSRAVTKKEKADGYALSKVTHVFNIDKAEEFSPIDGLINQVIKVGDNSTVLIKDIKVLKNETKITFKIEGNGAYNYRNFDNTVIIDENFNDASKTEDADTAVLENANEGIVSIKLPKIDKTKKYKIAIPIVDEPQMEDQYKIKIDLANTK